MKSNIIFILPVLLFSVIAQAVYKTSDAAIQDINLERNAFLQAASQVQTKYITGLESKDTVTKKDIDDALSLTANILKSPTALLTNVFNFAIASSHSDSDLTKAVNSIKATYNKFISNNTKLNVLFTKQTINPNEKQEMIGLIASYAPLINDLQTTSDALNKASFIIYADTKKSVRTVLNNLIPFVGSIIMTVKGNYNTLFPLKMYQLDLANSQAKSAALKARQMELNQLPTAA